jgi:hypothetical protein
MGHSSRELNSQVRQFNIQARRQQEFIFGSGGDLVRLGPDRDAANGEQR